MRDMPASISALFQARRFLLPRQFLDPFCIRLASLFLLGDQPLSSLDGVIVAHKTFPC